MRIYAAFFLTNAFMIRKSHAQLENGDSDGVFAQTTIYAATATHFIAKPTVYQKYLHPSKRIVLQFLADRKLLRNLRRHTLRCDSVRSFAKMDI